MNLKIPFTLSNFFVILFTLTCHDEGHSKIIEKNWSLQLEEKGVKIWSQQEDGSDIIAFRTQYIINAPIEKVMALLRDAANYGRWVEELDHIEYISEPSDLEATTYEKRNFPFPLDTRDLVINYQLAINNKKKSLSVSFKSVDHKNFPVTSKYVRAIVDFGQFEFWPLGSKTKIELTVKANPKGSIPNWVINIFQKKQPFDYILSIEKEAPKTISTLRPGIKKLISDYREKFGDLERQQKQPQIKPIKSSKE